MDIFILLVVIACFIVFIFLFVILPAIELIALTKQPKLEPESIPIPIQEQPKQIQIQQQPNMEIQIRQKEVEQIRNQIIEAGGIEKWIQKNPPTKQTKQYTPYFVEIWTVEWPYVCIYSNYESGRINRSAQQMVESESYGSCYGDPSCDVTQLIAELINSDKIKTQKWSFPRTRPSRMETSFLFPGIIRAGQSVLIRILMNPTENPNLYRTNWDMYLA